VQNSRRGGYLPLGFYKGVITPRILGGGGNNPNNPSYLRHCFLLCFFSTFLHSFLRKCSSYGFRRNGEIVSRKFRIFRVKNLIAKNCGNFLLFRDISRKLQLFCCCNFSRYCRIFCFSFTKFRIVFTSFRKIHFRESFCSLETLAALFAYTVNTRFKGFLVCLP